MLTKDDVKEAVEKALDNHANVDISVRNSIVKSLMLKLGSPRYCYSFSVWPCEDRSWPTEVFDTFRFFPRLELTLTEDEFFKYRNALAGAGFGLREIERTEYLIPESIA